MKASDSLSTDRTRIRRVPKRGHYDRATLDAILDAHILCHIAFVHQGSPAIIPTFYAREGDRILLHGSSKSRLMMALRDGAELSLAVTHLDAIVAARSVFHHSANYRSAVIYGRAARIESQAERRQALEVLTNRLLPGRWEEARLPSAKEMKATMVLAVPIIEGAAKIRTGPPGDEAADYALDIWAGLIPLQITAGEPIPDPKLKPGVERPPSVENYTF
ncbi:MAG: pyridoxamine 5'-phosphate oxidase family protein [Bacteroidota bacterium]